MRAEIPNHVNVESLMPEFEKCKDDEDVANLALLFSICEGYSDLYKELRRDCCVFLGNLEVAKSCANSGDYPAVIGFDLPEGSFKPSGTFALVRKEVPLDLMREVYVLPERLTSTNIILRGRCYGDVEIKNL
ncbi:MAG: hypothetical protein WC796_03750 [Candidatus Pacearchaeota archaeon]